MLPLITERGERFPQFFTKTFSQSITVWNIPRSKTRGKWWKRRWWCFAAAGANSFEWCLLGADLIVLSWHWQSLLRMKVMMTFDKAKERDGMILVTLLANDGFNLKLQLCLTFWHQNMFFFPIETAYEVWGRWQMWPFAGILYLSWKHLKASDRKDCLCKSPLHHIHCKEAGSVKTKAGAVCEEVKVRWCYPAIGTKMQNAKRKI